MQGSVGVRKEGGPFGLLYYRRREKSPSTTQHNAFFFVQPRAIARELRRRGRGEEDSPLSAPPSSYIGETRPPPRSGLGRLTPWEAAAAVAAEEEEGSPPSSSCFPRCPWGCKCRRSVGTKQASNDRGGGGGGKQRTEALEGRSREHTGCT